MSRIETLLAQNPTERLDFPVPTEAEIRLVEIEIGWPLPNSYREFVELNGLNDLRFRNEILRPTEIAENRTYVEDAYVPFASNGCGDLFCWAKQGGEPPVVFWDHEVQQCSEESGSFVEWLEKNRF